MCHTRRQNDALSELACRFKPHRLQRRVLSLLGGGAAGTIIVLGGWLRRRA